MSTIDFIREGNGKERERVFVVEIKRKKRVEGGGGDAVIRIEKG